MPEPWYMYPLDSPCGGYEEIIDPMGNYWKPDTNIRVPSGTPITAWDSGVITSVIDRGRTDAGLSVTEKLDNPPNGSAKYASFNYLGSASVNIGQRVNSGQEVGIAGSPYGVNFALGLGPSAVWGTLCPQCQGGHPEYDPRIVLNKLRSGGLPGLQNVAGNVPGGSVPVVGPVIDWLNQQMTAFKGLTSWISNPVRLFKLVGGILILGVGLFLLVAPQAEKVAGKVEEVAPFLAA